MGCRCKTWEFLCMRPSSLTKKTAEIPQCDMRIMLIQSDKQQLLRTIMNRTVCTWLELGESKTVSIHTCGQEDWFLSVHNVWTKIQSSSKKPRAKDSLKCCVTSLPAGLLDLLTHAVELRVQFRGDHGVCSILQTAGPVADDFICEQAQWKMVRPQAMKN